MAPNILLESLRDSQSPSIQKFAQTNYILKPLGHGGWATVYASLPRDLADGILQNFTKSQKTPENLQKALKELAQALQAVKIAHDPAPERERSPALQRNLTSEIDHLKHIRALGPAKNLSEMLDHDDDDNDRNQNRKACRWWYTLKPLNGGTLTEFLERGYFPQVQADFQLLYPPLSFAWHTVAQLLEALCLFHFGTNETDARRFHGDVTAANLMFHRPADPHAPFRDYPNAYITDFGAAEAVHLDVAPPREAENLFLKQRKDIVNAIFHCQRLVTPEKRDAFFQKEMENLNRAAYRASESDVLKARVTRLVRSAKKKRDEVYEPLSERTVSYFSRPLVTNDEFLGMFEELNKKPRVPYCVIL
ncbi:unnamed protein product [Lecanosticta acicola]|uniref:Unnamed protein product n=1 Tax=Lecanosticta acicola TaxID=111012 RepID=A0AAI8W0F0_9PEZI|nr:unnamed protein product [Lecanosticta acicola]